jgi:hypothetical protein
MSIPYPPRKKVMQARPFEKQMAVEPEGDADGRAGYDYGNCERFQVTIFL